MSGRDKIPMQMDKDAESVLKEIERRGGKLPEELEEFFRNVSWKPEASRLDIHGERVYYMPKGLPKLNGVRFLRTGLLLGELKKKRFEPSQAFAMSLKKEEYANILDLSVQRAHGEWEESGTLCQGRGVEAVSI